MNTLRPAHADDAPALAALWRRAWASANPTVAQVAPPAHWQARVRAEFGPPRAVQVLEVDGAPAAFLVLDVPAAYLHQMFVDPARQRQGTGAALLAWVRAACPQGGSLHVATDNTGARRFYERHGLWAGVADVHPQTGRARVRYHWGPVAPVAPVAPVNPVGVPAAR